MPPSNLQRAGACLAQIKVPGSQVARIGGEEFAMLQPSESAAAIGTISELVRINRPAQTSPSLYDYHRLDRG
jgi:GGDEF domain-containing protein